MKQPKFIQKIIENLDIYFSKNEVDDIEILEEQVDLFNTTIDELEGEARTREEILLDLMNEITVLKNKLLSKNKHQTLEVFKHYLDVVVVPKRKEYNFRNKGYEACHLSLEDYTPENMQKFISNVMWFDYKKYKTPDEMIYKFIVAFHKKFPNNKYYGTDIANYGVADYWESPNEAVARFTGDKSADCDAHGSALYGCIRYMLEQRFTDDLWRLRVFVVGPISGGGHYILSWIKEGPNDWIPLETTWYKNSIKRAWTENLPLRSQVAYKIWWSFDHEHEYIKL